MTEPVTKDFCDERHGNTEKLLQEIRVDVKSVKAIYYGNGDEGFKTKLATLKARIGWISALVLMMAAGIVTMAFR